jgi:hypothetical protein
VEVQGEENAGRNFSPLHILILLLSAFIVLGLPLLTILLLIWWANKRQPQPGTRISIPGVPVSGITDVFSSSILGTPLVIYVMAKFDVSSTSSGHAVTSIVHANPWLYGMQLAVGLSCSAFGDTWLLGSQNATNCSMAYFRHSYVYPSGCIPSSWAKATSRCSRRYCFCQLALRLLCLADI